MMLLRILGTDAEKERVVKLLQQKVAFDFPPDIPLGAKPEDVHLWEPSGKGK